LAEILLATSAVAIGIRKTRLENWKGEGAIVIAGREVVALGVEAAVVGAVTVPIALHIIADSAVRVLRSSNLRGLHLKNNISI